MAEDTKIGDIELAPGKYLHTCHRFIKTAMASDDKESIKAAFAELKKENPDKSTFFASRNTFEISLLYTFAVSNNNRTFANSIDLMSE